MSNNYKILIFGPQASGKGTQAKMLAEKLDIPHISTGAMYRMVQKQNNERSKILTQYLDAGKLVPDHYTNEMMNERLMGPDIGKGYILDGYPRNKIQFEFLNNLAIPTHVIAIQLPKEVSIERVAGRRVTPDGTTYHLKYDPPPQDLDPSLLKQRPDESKEAVEQRLAIYTKDTEPLIEAYRKAGVNVIDIDGKPSIEDVSLEIKERLEL